MHEEEENEQEATPEKFAASKSPRVTRRSLRNGTESSQNASYDKMSPVQHSGGAKTGKSLEFSEKAADIMPAALQTEVVSKNRNVYFLFKKKRGGGSERRNHT